MSEPMTVFVEVWPVAADEAGIWLLSGDDAWRWKTPVMADSEPHGEVELLLANNEALESTALTHSTSWRTDGTSVVLTYVAVLRCVEAVRATWKSARPISVPLTNAVGAPPTHAPVEAPAPRYIDVLLHGVRHLRFLLDTDATSAAALDGHWPRHLEDLQPSLAGMYSQRHIEP